MHNQAQGARLGFLRCLFWPSDLFSNWKTVEEWEQTLSWSNLLGPLSTETAGEALSMRPGRHFLIVKPHVCTKHIPDMIWEAH